MILEKIKKAKKVKFFVKDRVLRLENRDITDVGLGEEYAEEFYYKPGVNIFTHLYILRKEGIDIEVAN